MQNLPIWHYKPDLLSYLKEYKYCLNPGLEEPILAPSHAPTEEGRLMPFRQWLGGRKYWTGSRAVYEPVGSIRRPDEEEEEITAIKEVTSQRALYSLYSAHRALVTSSALVVQYMGNMVPFGTHRVC